MQREDPQVNISKSAKGMQMEDPQVNISKSAKGINVDGRSLGEHIKEC